jgi:hypothetical protein
MVAVRMQQSRHTAKIPDMQVFIDIPSGWEMKESIVAGR